MLALIVHPEKRPELAKGALLVPLARWEESKIPLRILREEARSNGRSPGHFVTLVQVPESQLVAVVIGPAPKDKAGLLFAPLGSLQQEDKEIVERSLETFRNPGQTELGVAWLARFVLGDRLPEHAIKWTKDFRLLQKGAKNASTKRT